jgi:hypothetical protein
VKRSFRIALPALFGVIAFLALAFAALARPTNLWASTIWSVTLAALVFSLVAVIVTRRPTRAFWIGFWIVGWTHFIVALGPTIESDTGFWLPLSWNVLDRPQSLVTRQWSDGIASLLGHTRIRSSTANRNPDNSAYFDAIKILQCEFTLLFATLAGAAARWLNEKSGGPRRHSEAVPGK